MNPIYRLLCVTLPILALVVVVMGAYVRLTDAGLGCPDWPGCYGRLIVSSEPATVDAATMQWGDRPFDAGKAWREMIHRYAASLLGFGVLCLAFLAWRSRKDTVLSTIVPLVLVPLVVFQGLLGMWTVTLLLKPAIVLTHLFGGLLTLSLLWWHLLRVLTPFETSSSAGAAITRMVNIAILVLVIQILLGGWTSSNYAALACVDFPTCQGSYWPEMDFANGFILWRGLGIDYEFGVLETPARTAIHYTHRLWAFVALIVIAATALRALSRGDTRAVRTGWCILLLLGAQIGLGIANVVLGMPLGVAVAHNGGAAMLLLSLVTLRFFVAGKPGTMHLQ